MIKNLIIAAHPDDEIIGCGGTINKLIKKGETVNIVFMAEGVTSRYEKKEIHSIKALKEIKIRENNANKANQVLGLKAKNIIFLKNSCCRMDSVPILEHSKSIEKYIKLFKPNRIFTHNPNDLNIDHRLTYQATMVATRPKKENSFLTEILCFEVLSSTNLNLNKPFKPNLFIDITSSINKKILALSKYQKETSKNSGRDKDKIRGHQTGRFFVPF